MVHVIDAAAENPVNDYRTVKEVIFPESYPLLNYINVLTNCPCWFCFHFGHIGFFFLLGGVGGVNHDS